MSAITLKNRVTTYSDSDTAFASCTALPIHQTTLNAAEMAGIDGLWDWGDFVSNTLAGAVTGAVNGAVTGAVLGSTAGGVGALPGAAQGLLIGGGVGAVTGAAGYVWDEITADVPGL